MIAQPEDRTVALTVSGEELKRRGWTAWTLTREQALDLVKGFCPGRVKELALYPALDGVLIVARWKPMARPAPRRPLRRGRVRRT